MYALYIYINNSLIADEKGANEAAKRANAKAETLGDELHASEAALQAVRDEAKDLKVRLKKESASSQVAGTCCGVPSCAYVTCNCLCSVALVHVMLSGVVIKSTHWSGMCSPAACFFLGQIISPYARMRLVYMLRT